MEGNDDERFFKHIIKSGFVKGYDHVKLYQYAAQKPAKIENFLRSIAAMKADYMVVADIDQAPCISLKKEKLRETKIKGKMVDDNSIMVVIKEIESWYLAGIPSKDLKQLGIGYNGENTDTLTKEQFNRLMPAKFGSRIDFMQEILKYFQVETARRNNKSFGYFIKKFKTPTVDNTG